MIYRAHITVRAALNRLKTHLINGLLGYAAGAGQFVADNDARIVGMVPRSFAPAGFQHSPFLNHLRVIHSP